MANLVILILLSLIFSFLCVCCGIEFRHRSAQKTKAVYLPNFMLWLGLLSGFLFLAFAWFAAKDDGSIGLTIGFGVFVLLGMLLMLGWKNCFITYDDNGITQHNLIGMQRSFFFDQVTGWYLNKRNPMESVLYANGKKITFNFTSENGAAFLLTVSNQYRKIHGNQTLPKLTGLQKERGGFCAHVYNPGEYLAIFIMLLVFILGTGAWLAIDCLIPVSESNSVHHTVEFTSLQVDEDSIILSSPQMEESFVIFGFQGDASKIQQLREACNGNTTFSAWVQRFDPKDSAPYFKVYALSSGTEVYHTFESSNAYRQENIPGIIGIFGIFLLVFLVFSGFIYIVGSHPDKFPKWVVYSCFQKNAIDI